MAIETLENYLESFIFSKSSKNNNLYKYDNTQVCNKINYLLNFDKESKVILARFLNKEILETEDFYEIIYIYLNEAYVTEIIPIYKKMDINEFIEYGLDNFGFDEKLGYHKVLYAIEKENKNKYLEGEISVKNYNILHPVKDVNLYLDKIREKNKKYDLDKKEDYLEIYEIIRNVSFFNIADYKEKDYCLSYNTGFYDKFNTSLSIENYKFLYGNYYKYDEDYLHQLYFDKHNIEGYGCMGYGYSGSKCSNSGNNLALEIQGDFNEILSKIDLKNKNIDEKLLKFIISNTNDVDWKIYLDKKEKRLIDLEEIKILINDYNIINIEIIKAGISIDQKGFEDFIYKKYIENFNYLRINDSQNGKFIIKLINEASLIKQVYKENDIKLINKKLNSNINSSLFDYINENTNYYFSDLYFYLDKFLKGNNGDGKINMFDIIENTDIDLLISFFKFLDIDISNIKTLKPGFILESPEFKSGDFYVNKINHFISEKMSFLSEHIDYNYNQKSRTIETGDIQLPYPDYTKEQLNLGLVFRGESFKRLILDFLNNSLPDFYNEQYFNNIYDEYYEYKDIDSNNSPESYKAREFLLSNKEKDIFRIIKLKSDSKTLHPRYTPEGNLKSIKGLKLETSKFFISGFEKLFNNIDFLGVYYDKKLTEISNSTKHIALNMLFLGKKIPFLLDEKFYFIGEYQGGMRFSHNIYDDYSSNFKIYADVKGDKISDLEESLKYRDLLISTNIFNSDKGKEFLLLIKKLVEKYPNILNNDVGYKTLEGFSSDSKELQNIFNELREKLPENIG